jgi:DNA polymerase III epsilon subunit-like protein
MNQRVVIFDTETTGLPKDRNQIAVAAAGNWPDIVSICWHVYDNGVLWKKEHHIIKPFGWTIPEESTKIHGITDLRAHTEGKSLKDILDDFKADAKSCDRLVAHNFAFDSNVVMNAYKWRLGEDCGSWWPYKAEFCTMMVAAEELKIPGPKGYKWPRLDDLYTATFNEPAPAGAHSADRDVEVLAKIYFKRYSNIDLEEMGNIVHSCIVM